MALNDKVTAEQYEATLRDSVNAYYEHAKNDPPMSQDEVISSTAQMAENYHNAVDDFNAAQAEANENMAETNEAAAEVSTTESVDSGIDGDDGGIE